MIQNIVSLFIRLLAVALIGYSIYQFVGFVLSDLFLPDSVRAMHEMGPMREMLGRGILINGTQNISCGLALLILSGWLTRVIAGAPSDE